ncbi:hypothetical protein D3C73_449190 [compost metagenome]|jgi:hypothetical protein
MTPNFRLTSLAIDPLELRACVSFTDEEVVLTAKFPFRPEYDMPFGEVREQAERRALELLASAARPRAD